MPEREHIDLEILEKYVLGRLAEKEAEVVRRHLETCARCGLELKRLQRFGTVDSDEDLARQGEWLYARTKLEKTFREKIAPSVAGARTREVRFPRALRVARWLVPAAAAAAVILMVAHYGMNGRPGAPASGP
ncbi:MAG TPA: zf-HC2 domain-containing protein, partial [Candidatus Bathyarchaeia archaeon]|nr:zf-HC2 domain-containing protein [Candidatus Bathyarchaeia archaeon]